MHLTLTQKIYLGFVLLAIYVLSWFLQFNALISWDVSWGLHEAARMLAGGVNGIDYFEPTPPMFLYLYLPPVLLSKFSSLSIMLAMQLYIFAICAFSLIICSKLIKQIFSKDSMVGYLWLLAIAASFLLLTLRLDAGQREHFAIILIVPYLLLAGARVQPSIISRNMAIIVGLMAGIGFGIKPYFCMSLFLVEFYLLIKLKHKTFSRTELLTISLLLVIYTLYSIIFHRSYFTIIIPLAMQFYYQGYAVPWHSVLLTTPFLFCGFSLFFYLLYLHSNKYKTLSTVLILGMIGFAFSYVMQRNEWYYHLLPVYTLNFIILALLSLLLSQQSKLSFRDYLTLSLVTSAAIGFIIYNKFDGTTFVVNKYSDYAYFACVFGLMFYLSKVTKLVELFIKTSIVMAIMIGFNFLIRGDNWHAQQYSLTILIGMLGFTLLLPRQYRFKTCFITLLVLALFSFPFNYARIKYYSSIAYKNGQADLIQFMSKNANQQPVYFFSTLLSSEYPSVDYAGAVPVSQFATFFWMPGFFKQMADAKLDEGRKSSLSKANNYLVATVIQEIKANKPKFIFVEKLDDGGLKNYFAVNFVGYFSTFPAFSSVWENYHYVATIKSRVPSQFDVYERKKD